MSNTLDSQHSAIEETFRCLEITFSKGSKSEDINEAQKRLMELEKNILSHLKIILDGLTLNDNYTENLKLSTIIYIKNSIINRIKNKLLSDLEVWEVIRYFVDFLISADLTEKLLNNTTSLLQGIFNNKIIVKDPNSISDLIQKIESFLKNHIEQNMTNDLNFKIGIFKRIIGFMQMMISTKSINNQNIDNAFASYMNIIDLVNLKNQTIIQAVLSQGITIEKINYVLDK